MKKTGFAFILACLQAYASAQREDDDGSESILNTLLIALLDPSTEYMHIYFCIAMGVLAFLIGVKTIHGSKRKVSDMGEANSANAKMEARRNLLAAAKGDEDYCNIDSEALFKELD